MNLSEHFSLDEFIDSQTATRLSIDEQFSPPESVKENLKSLCEDVLEAVRSAVCFHLDSDVPIIINSGYRCERLNEAIGGAKISQHVKGQAADIKCFKLSTEELYQLIKNSGIIYDQLIQEFDKWIHISYTAVGENRKENLRAIKVSGVTKYISDVADRAV